MGAGGDQTMGGPAHPGQYLLCGHQSPSLIDLGREQGSGPGERPKSQGACLLSAAQHCCLLLGLFLGKIPALGPFPLGPRVPPGTPNWCSGAERVSDRGLPTVPRLEQEKSQEPVALSSANPAIVLDHGQQTAS